MQKKHIIILSIGIGLFVGTCIGFTGGTLFGIRQRTVYNPNGEAVPHNVIKALLNAEFTYYSGEDDSLLENYFWKNRDFK